MYAPVFITTLNRFDHFKNCIESLLVCNDSENTDLFIALDFPSKSTHWDGYEKINEYIKTINGFKSVNIIKRDINYGSSLNYFDALDKIFLEYDSVIVTEDDNIFSKDFIQYMNNSLLFYKDNKEIFAICGYGFPIEFPKNFSEDYYIWTGFSGWGTGIWKFKWNEINWNKDFINYKLTKFSNNNYKMFLFSKVANIYIPSIYNEINSTNIHGDIVISVHLFENKKYCIFPVISRVRNNGHDGSGANCSFVENDLFSTQKIYEGHEMVEVTKKIVKKKHIYKALYYYFKMNKILLFKYHFKNQISHFLKKII